MSTHNIGFYEDLTNIIFELSSNIIKYAPYFFCCCSAAQATYSLEIIGKEARCIIQIYAPKTKKMISMCVCSVGLWAD